MHWADALRFSLRLPAARAGGLDVTLIPSVGWATSGRIDRSSLALILRMPLIPAKPKPAVRFRLRKRQVDKSRAEYLFAHDWAKAVNQKIRQRGMLA